MKKLFTVLVVLVLSLTLVGCTGKVVLPDLEGQGLDEIRTTLDNLEVNYRFIYTTEENDQHELEFYGYKGYDSGDKVSKDVEIIVYIYPESDDYFEVVDMVYDGPYLSESFATIDYLDPRGGYFDVTLKYCTDGDTAVFNYPTDVYNAIDSSAKSVRFLNMDTEETYNGGEEEWGKPASVYSCELLETAESIKVQTDPGDNLLGNYGRLLGWVWIKQPNQEEYFLLNYMVVKQGLAQVKYEFGAGETIRYGDHTYNEWMHIAEDYAIENELGQWGDFLDYYWDYDRNRPDTSKW